MSTPAARLAPILLALAACPAPEAVPATPDASTDTAAPADTAAPEEEAPLVCGDTPPTAEASLSFREITVGGGQPGSVKTTLLWGELAVRVQDADGDLAPRWQVAVWWASAAGELDLSRRPSWRTVVRAPRAEPCLGFAGHTAWSTLVAAETAGGPLVRGQPYRLAVVVTDAGGMSSAPVFVEGVVP